MANNNWPHGFKPLGLSYTGGPVGTRQYAKTASDTNAIYQWDLLAKAATSQITEGQMIPDPGCKTYSQGTPGTTLILGSSLNFGAASTISWLTVVDDPTAMFEAQCTGSTTMSVATDVGLNGTVDNTAQTNGTIISAMGIQSATVATTNSLDIRILDLYRSLSNAEGLYAIVECFINRHANGPAQTGV